MCLFTIFKVLWCVMEVSKLHKCHGDCICILWQLYGVCVARIYRIVYAILANNCYCGFSMKNVLEIFNSQMSPSASNTKENTEMLKWWNAKLYILWRNCRIESVLVVHQAAANVWQFNCPSDISSKFFVRSLPEQDIRSASLLASDEAHGSNNGQQASTVNNKCPQTIYSNLSLICVR